jgi:hypothetical protein
VVPDNHARSELGSHFPPHAELPIVIVGFRDQHCVLRNAVGLVLRVRGRRPARVLTRGTGRSADAEVEDEVALQSKLS